MSDYVPQLQAVQSIAKQIIPLCDELLTDQEALDELHVECFRAMYATAHHLQDVLKAIIVNVRETNALKIGYDNILFTPASALRLNSELLLMTEDDTEELSIEHKAICQAIFEHSNDILKRLSNIFFQNPKYSDG